MKRSWHRALVTLLALFIFGYAKGHFTGAPAWRSAFQTAFIGGLCRGRRVLPSPS